MGVSVAGSARCVDISAIAVGEDSMGISAERVDSFEEVGIGACGGSAGSGGVGSTSSLISGFGSTLKEEGMIYKAMLLSMLNLHPTGRAFDV